MAAFPVPPPGCPHTLFQGKRHEGCRSVGAFCKPHLRAQELGSTGSTGCQVLPLLAGCISLSGDGSWCQVLTALTYTGIFLLLCHERDPCHVLLLGPDPSCGEKGQQELALQIGIHTLGAMSCMIIPMPSSILLLLPSSCYTWPD